MKGDRLKAVMRKELGKSCFLFLSLEFQEVQMEQHLLQDSTIIVFHALLITDLQYLKFMSVEKLRKYFPSIKTKAEKN